MSLKLFACGDMVNLTAKKDFVDEKLKDIIQSSDISICNFEAPIETKDMKFIKKAGPLLYQSTESIDFLKDVGFSDVSIANNHIYDYGQEALKNTLEQLKKNNIGYIGGGIDYEEAYRTRIIEKNGISIGLLSVCENEFGCLFENQNRGGYAWIFHDLIEDNIRKLKQEVDTIVIIAHAGVEDISFPIKEWRDRYKRLCDVGVDVVIGHHPHVPQGYEKYNNSMIFYSLGNFYFDTASFKDKSDDSYSVVLEFKKNGLKNFEIVYHKKIGNRTCKVGVNEVSFSMDTLNALLGNNYQKRNDDICLELFYKYYYNYYEIALGKMPKKTNFLNKIKFIIIKLFFRNKNRDNRYLLLLHNIKIDSHRFVVQRALSLISEQENKL